MMVNSEDTKQLLAVDRPQGLIRKQLITSSLLSHCLVKAASFAGRHFLTLSFTITCPSCIRGFSVPQCVNSDLYSHILRLGGSHLSPGGLLVVVHLVAQRLLPVDGFGLGGDIKTERKEVNISC